MARQRLLNALVLSGMLFIASTSLVSADEDKQKDKAKKIPEVPVAAAIPLVALVAGGGFYLVARRRRARAERPSN